MRYKGVDVNVGDFVALRSKSVPLPEVQAAVIDVEHDGNRLVVISSFLVPFQHNGEFPSDDVTDFMVLYPAEQAIPLETREKAFQKDQRVFATIRGERMEGGVIAAFDGMVLARRDDGQLITAGIPHLQAVA